MFKQRSKLANSACNSISNLNVRSFFHLLKLYVLIQYYSENYFPPTLQFRHTLKCRGSSRRPVLLLNQQKKCFLQQKTRPDRNETIAATNKSFISDVSHRVFELLSNEHHHHRFW